MLKKIFANVVHHPQPTEDLIVRDAKTIAFLQRCDRHLLLDCKTHWSRFAFDWPIFAAIEFRCRVIQRWTGQRKVNGKFRREIRLKRSQWVGGETFPWGEGVAETFERDEDEGWLKRRDGTVRRYSFANGDSLKKCGEKMEDFPSSIVLFTRFDHRQIRCDENETNQSLFSFDDVSRTIEMNADGENLFICWNLCWRLHSIQTCHLIEIFVGSEDNSEIFCFYYLHQDCLMVFLTRLVPAELGTKNELFSPNLFLLIKSERGSKCTLPSTSCWKMRLEERNRTRKFSSHMMVLFSEKMNFLQRKWRFYIETAQLGTKSRLPGISKTIKKFEENRPPWPCHCRSEAKAHPFGANLVPFDREIFGLIRKTEFGLAVCRTLEFPSVYKTVKISRQN